MATETFDTVVIGAGQAGLSAGYFLKRAGRSFVIVDGQDRVGGSWLTRYDSLHLFTPRFAVRLPGMRVQWPPSSARPRTARPTLASRRARVGASRAQRAGPPGRG